MLCHSYLVLQRLQWVAVQVSIQIVSCSKHVKTSQHILTKVNKLNVPKASKFCCRNLTSWKVRCPFKISTKKTKNQGEGFCILMKFRGIWEVMGKESLFLVICGTKFLDLLFQMKILEILNKTFLRIWLLKCIDYLGSYSQKPKSRWKNKQSKKRTFKARSTCAMASIT